MMVKTVVFDNYLGKMSLENKIRSIFDTLIAGQTAIDGNYYCIHTDHKTHEKYALTKESENKIRSLGYALDQNQEAIFNGEKVRGMTEQENYKYNMDNLMAHIDLWGNIAVEEEFDMKWYMENCM